MKKLIAIIMCAVLLCSMSAFAVGEDITVLIDGAELEAPIAPRLVNNRTMLPMRAIFEKLGAKVTWMGFETNVVIATCKSKLITMQIDNFDMKVEDVATDEREIVKLESAPYYEQGHTLVPARAVAEALDAKVEWINETRTVVITTAQATETTEETQKTEAETREE